VVNFAAMKAFSEFEFSNHFVETFPGDAEKQNFTRAVKEALYSEVTPTPVKAPILIAWSERLGEELGIEKPGFSDKPSDTQTLAMISGNGVSASMRPYAARYGGHQFGNWAGQLGDGRAITLGEAETRAGKREFQLKGAGPTPYSRRGDGRAVLRSSIREFLCSEAMHFLGVPTTRALSLVTTGDEVIRDFFYDGNPKAEPGAIVMRVSESFLRFGNFQILAERGEISLLKNLCDFAIREFYPGLSYAEFLQEVARKTAVMVAHWMRVGFVHGVMNTDNMSILGVTIDYGPYGWLEPYEPNWTPNTTDAERKRYAFGNQPGIALWNIARFAEALSPLIDSQAELEKSLSVFRETLGKTYTQMMAEKLGLLAPLPEDQDWVKELFRLMEASSADYVLFFRALSNWNAKSDLLPLIRETFYREDSSAGLPTDLPMELSQGWAKWIAQYLSRVHRDGQSENVRLAAMKKVNPKYVLRNYLAQNAIKAAEKGDYLLITKLLRVLEKPYDEQPEFAAYSLKRPEWAKDSPGSSTLSCSS
jgi:uncharacterized protein YdiU (UPF0061 family)